MKKKLPVILHSLFFIFCFTLAVLILHHLISSRYLKIEYTPSSSEESSQNLDNPYRGFYQMGGYILSDKETPKTAANWCKKKLHLKSLPTDASGNQSEKLFRF